jgi:hypothetical protein
MDTPYGATYADARRRFLEAAEAAKAAIAQHILPQRGPSSEELAIDTAWVGPADAAQVLVTTSATHGVEGYFGSAVQVEWLRRFAKTMGLAKGLAAFHIHAVNPYGFAWSRRTNEDNIDINRNWLDFAAALPQNTPYDELAETLCPVEWDDETQRRTQEELLTWMQRHGFAAFQKAVSEGQHRHPHGLFYSGVAPCWSRNTLSGIVRSNLSAASRVHLIDFHTGLGPYGYAEPIIGQPRGHAAFVRTRAWIGGAARSLYGDGSASAEIKGDGMTAMPMLLPRTTVDCVALECGIRPILEVLGALRADAWLHRHGDPRSEAGAQISNRLKSAFHSDDPLWQGMALGQGLAACQAALASLSEPSAHG